MVPAVTMPVTITSEIEIDVRPLNARPGSPARAPALGHDQTHERVAAAAAVVAARGGLAHLRAHRNLGRRGADHTSRHHESEDEDAGLHSFPPGAAGATGAGSFLNTNVVARQVTTTLPRPVVLVRVLMLRSDTEISRDMVARRSKKRPRS